MPIYSEINSLLVRILWKYEHKKQGVFYNWHYFYAFYLKSMKNNVPSKCL